MKETPLLYTGPMMRAVLDDLKNQTRRIIKPQPEYQGKESFGDSWAWRKGKDGFSGVTREQLTGKAGLLYPGRCPYGVPGDRLWVKETFYCDHCQYQGALAGLPPLTGDDLKRYMYYEADGPVRNQIPECEGVPKLKPSIFMPRWASRLTLEIVRVRVERLREISADDAIAEGITEADYYVPNVTGMLKGRETETPVDGYRRLWEAINGKKSWDKNPWVWVIEFKKV